MQQENKRLLSLDALRGFDMFWITGGDELIHIGAKIFGWGWLVVLSQQFHHPEWNGLSAYDCIFPLFIFMAGVSVPFSFGSRMEKGVPKHKLAKKAIQRGLILVLLGIVYNNGILVKSFSEMRYASVLGRIGLAGMFAQLLYLYNPSALKLLIQGAVLLLIYWAFLSWFPVPGCPLGTMTMECNPASYIDQLILPGKLYKGIHDPEGFASTIPAVMTGLLGILAGMRIRNHQTQSGEKKVHYLMRYGAIALILGVVWSFFWPLNKNLWTGSFVLVVGGISFLLLALFYWVIDVKKLRRWTLFFVVIGTNSIVIYLLSHFVDIGYTANALFGGLLASLGPAAAELGEVLTYILVQWCLMYVLYKNKWFLKV
ncbi:DUF5009 domain-containing protein [Parapedobacter defluvii]|uniref:DUF5009 domain-containing protein n=1 Tax=Parapedobacter defluvii TaxID=2045106 RepID=A0ABQ1LWT6_9SPHI|nr:DUF5009 domain-containing protein [Parapedobacter defluvii]RQP11799.1 MAG: DUF5009 domain-containing protein [Parapedobacter sp.]GGC30923.1 DUF5009 domain-containing protein [Parapedobacter defluvii]